MPAAMRALVTICGWAATRYIGFLRGVCSVTIAANLMRRNIDCTRKQKGRAMPGLSKVIRRLPYSAGSTLTRTRRRSPGS